MALNTPEAIQAREDGYVECSECGHVLEQHIGGCVACDCAPWTKTAVEKLRREYGLPGRWNPARLAG